jgi:hypothetical protein
MKANNQTPIKLDIPTTEPGKSYWNQNGRYQAEYDELYELLVPAEGMAETLFGEVVRAASRLSWDYYNNGNMNACEVTEIEGDWVGDEEDGYQEESEIETAINPYYEKFIQILRAFFTEEMPKAIKIMDAIEDIILAGDNCDFNANEERPYILMLDAVCYIIRSKAFTLQEAAQRSPEIYDWYNEE